jgi:hypothetical protein
VARSFGAAALGFLAISLAFPPAAHAFSIHSFAPADVTLGTRLVIEGDFADLAASGEQPKVVGTRMDTPRTVNFQVLKVSRHKIVAKVRSVPSSKQDPAAGKTWSLRVRSPSAGGTAQADESFTTAGPELVALFDAEARPGQAVALFALDPGGPKLPTVLVGRKKAKVFDLAPVGPSADDDPWQVSFRVPNLRNGFHPVRLENALGRSARFADFLIFGGLKGGLVARASAAIESQPALEAPVCSASADGSALRVSACDGPDCARALEVAFEPDSAGGYQPAAVSLREARTDRAPVTWVAARASARLVPSPASELVAGTFVAELQPAGSSRGPLLRMRGYFQAPTPASFAAR